MTNFINQMDSVMSIIISNTGLEIVSTLLVCVGFVKVVEVIYKIAKNGYTNEKGSSIVGYSVLIGIGRVLPELFAYLSTLLGA